MVFLRTIARPLLARSTSIISPPFPLRNTPPLRHFAPISSATSHASFESRITYSTRTPNDHILTLSCPDRPGIVHTVTGLLLSHSLNILESQQFSDPSTSTFFLRIHFGGHNATLSPTSLTTGAFHSLFSPLRSSLACTSLNLHPVASKPRVLVLVSKQLHCLADLLFRAGSSGQLPVEIAAVVSNHNDARALAEGYGVPFYHLPVSAATKPRQEERLLELVSEHEVELVVLARYMQVLSPGLCGALTGAREGTMTDGREKPAQESQVGEAVVEKIEIGKKPVGVVNIHHSFLPSFKGAKPYYQAYERGVKLIGATAHFVTEGLDEGPIIEQAVKRVDHSMSPRELTQEGSVIETQVLAQAVRLVAERRVLLNGNKTVVFS